MHRNAVAIVFVVIAAAIVPKAAFLTKNGLSWELQQGNDEHRHLVYSKALADSFTFGEEPCVPSAFQPPGYPIFLVPFIRLWGWRPVQALWAQVAIASFCCGMCAWIGCRLNNWLSGAIAGILAATYLPMISYPTYFLSESLFLFLFTATLLLFDFAFAVTGPKQRSLAAVGLGVMHALVALTRFVAFPLFFVSGTLILFRHGKLTARAMAVASLILAAFAFAYSPWIVRNAAQFQQLIVLSPKGELASGFAHYCAQHIREGEDLGTARKSAYRELDRLATEGRSLDAEVQRFSVRYLADCSQRLGIMLGVHPVLNLPFPFAGCRYGNSWISNWVNYLWTAVMYVGVLLSMVHALVYRDVRLLHTILLPLALLILYSLIHAIPRYQVASYAAWSIPAGVGWASAIGWAGRVFRQTAASGLDHA